MSSNSNHFTTQHAQARPTDNPTEDQSILLDLSDEFFAGFLAGMTSVNAMGDPSSIQNLASFANGALPQTSMVGLVAMSNPPMATSPPIQLVLPEVTPPAWDFFPTSSNLADSVDLHCVTTSAPDLLSTWQPLADVPDLTNFDLPNDLLSTWQPLADVPDLTSFDLPNRPTSLGFSLPPILEHSAQSSYLNPPPIDQNFRDLFGSASQLLNGCVSEPFLPPASGQITEDIWTALGVSETFPPPDADAVLREPHEPQAPSPSLPAHSSMVNSAVESPNPPQPPDGQLQLVLQEPPEIVSSHASPMVSALDLT